MLRQLYISNFTLIDTLDIRFNPGFSVITGETGAGKSIILGAINLLLGQRADSKSLKADCSKCVIEAHFDISQYDMRDFFVSNDIDYDAADCILRRELNSSGKSRAFINDTPVSLNTIRTLGQQLVDIHSQHQNLALNEDDFQLKTVDIIAQDAELLNEYRQRFTAYKSTKKELSRLQAEIEESRKNEDFMRFQHKELTDANLTEGIQEELERESEKLSHVEDIKTALYATDAILNADDCGDGVLNKIKEAIKLLDNLRNIYGDITPLAERLESCYIELKDITDEISSEEDNIEFDPARLDEINGQLDKIYTLEKKHQLTTVAELIDLRKTIEKQLSKIENYDAQLAELEKLEKLQLEKCIDMAGRLSAVRQEAAKTIEKEMLGKLVPLGIPNVRFSVNIENKELSINGCDKVTFLFSANTGLPMQPVSHVASGGEIARVMLSLKAMISGAVKLPTIIFDEIDTGVSGKIAEKMGGIMQEMASAERQVISITHLPQIAARGATHYKVYKEETETGTKSRVQVLDEKERIYEIAQMLSGTEVTDAAINNAKELLKKI
ncbi:MAG: DNA repair protein RecN [Prevotella sp.]|nr:DNA repair protein RecN [Prevotella sp.]